MAPRKASTTAKHSVQMRVQHLAGTKVRNLARPTAVLMALLRVRCWADYWERKTAEPKVSYWAPTTAPSLAQKRVPNSAPKKDWS
jgi:hypothetical protein